MNVDALLLLQPSDLTHLAAHPGRWDGLRRLMIDPGLVEQAAATGIDVQPFEFRSLDVPPYFQARILTEAATRAAALDLALTRHRESLFGPGALAGWDQGLLRQGFVRVLLFAALGRACEAAFPERRIGLFRPSNPQLFYFDSRLTTDAFAAGSPRWHLLDEYPAGANWEPDAFGCCFDFEAVQRIAGRDAPQAVVPVPTTYRHANEYATQIAAAFDRFLDLPSAFWDIPLRREEPLLQPVASTVGAPFREACIVYAERARATLREHLREMLPDEAGLAAQVDLLSRRALMQALNFHGLRDALAGHRPRFVLTDHDTGNNGPLFAVAAALDAPITIVPHSSYVTGAIPHARRVEVVERDGFATPMRSVWGEAVARRGVALGPQVERRPRTQVRTVCMLVNGMVSNGLFHIDFLGTVRFHRRLAELCAAHGVRLVLRLKPTAPGLQLFAAATGVPADALARATRPTLETVAAKTDLCVSFGQPTTGTISFLAAGAYLMHAAAMAWSTDPAFSPAYFSDGTVPCTTPDEALARIEALIASQDVFAAYAARQYAAFGARLDGPGRIFGDGPTPGDAPRGAAVAPAARRPADTRAPATASAPPGQRGSIAVSTSP
ncbi:MAG: hypothetical protein ACK5XG_06135 [Burkholderiales bacterium]